MPHMTQVRTHSCGVRHLRSGPGAVLRIVGVQASTRAIHHSYPPPGLGALLVNERSRNAPGGPGDPGPVTIFGPDFPFPFDDWIAHPAGLGSIPAERHGEEVAVVGAGISGLVAAYELMKLGIKPVVYEASQMGGRLRSQAFEGAEGMIAELGGMRFPVSSTSFYHYVDMLGLQTRPFPNPLTEAAGSTVVDLEGVTHYARTLEDLPPLFAEVADAWAQA